MKNHTDIPLVLIAETAATAAQRFGPVAADCRLATYDEVLAGGLDGELDRAAMVAIAEGPSAMGVLRHLLARGESAPSGLEIAFELPAGDRRTQSDAEQLIDQFPGFERFDVRVVGRASALRVVASVDRRSADAGAGKPRTGFFPKAQADTTAVEEFALSAAEVRAGLRVQQVRGDYEGAERKLQQARKQLTLVEQRSHALQGEVEALRSSRWVRWALRGQSATARIAERLRLRPRTLIGLVAGVAAVVLVGLALLVAGPLSLVNGAIAVASLVLIGLVLLLLLITRRNGRRLGEIRDGLGQVKTEVSGIERRLSHEQKRIAKEGRSRSDRQTKRQAAALTELDAKLERSEGSLVDLGGKSEQQAESLAELHDKLNHLQDIALRAPDGAPAEILARIESVSKQVQDGFGTASSAEIPTWFRQFEQRYIRKGTVERQQTQATVNLYALARPSAAVPAMGGWAASPDVLLMLVDELLAVRPRTAVDFGSGVSTLWLALTVREHSLPTHIVSFEHDEKYLIKTHDALRRHGVDGLVDLRLAPLQTQNDGDETPWYARSQMQDLVDVGLVFVDGPPTATGPDARMPAVPALLGTLAEKCTIILDDLVRPEEKRVAQAWQALLPDFTYDEVPFEKGAAVFRRP